MKCMFFYLESFLLHVVLYILYIIMYIVLDVQDKFDSFMRENKKVLCITTFDRLKINSTGSEITLLSTRFTQNIRY